MVFFLVNNNNLSGHIPESLGDLPELSTLYLYNNQLSGEIPESICNLEMDVTNSNIFRLYNNSLCPVYPDCIIENIGEQDTTLCGAPDCIAGDLNNDGFFNILDIVMLSDCILDGSDNTFCYCGDMNNDGEMNVLDIVELVDIILEEV